MFREKYRKDNELIKAPVKTQEEIMNMTEKKQKMNTSGRLRTAAIAAACVLIAVFAALPFFLNLGSGQEQPAAVVSLGDLRTAGTYSELYEIIEGMQSTLPTYGMLTDGVMTDSVAAAGAQAEVKEESGDFFATNSAMDDANTPEHSETNNQVEGVDEADIIKTDGHYIYRLAGSEIVIINAAEMSVVSRIEPDILTAEERSAASSFWLSNIYISGDRLAILFSKHIYNEEEMHFSQFSGVIVYDISDRSAPALVGHMAQSGDLADSRLIGDHIYLISNYSFYNAAVEGEPRTYIPELNANGACILVDPEDICILPDPSTASYVVMTSVSISDGTGFDSVQATFGYGATVYADTETVLLSFSTSHSKTSETQEDGRDVTITSNSDETTIIRYNISGGKITLTAQGSVPGSLLNQFSIDRYNDVIRVVTTLNTWTQKIYTEGVDQYDFESSTTNGLYTLDANLQPLGKLDGLAEDERVYSVRFSGDIGYFVTFRQVDPLFAVDLSDPAAPTLLSALKIPGFSQYMHPYADGLLFGFGMDADEETGRTNGLKLSMFDVSDPTNVTERHKLIMEDTSWSEALYDHKAIMVYADRNIIAFPSHSGYMVYSYGDNGFYKRFELDMEQDYYYSTPRGLFIGDSFYICTEHTLYRYDLNTFEAQGKLVINEYEPEIVS